MKGYVLQDYAVGASIMARWPQFAEALAKAKEVLDDPSADQETVNKANSDLTVAFLMLRKKQ